MKKEFKKRLSIFLCIVMVLCNTLPSLANETETNAPKAKIVEQLKEDLGEEKVEEIINSSEIIKEEGFNENEENMNDEKEPNDSEENLVKNEEDFIKNEENTNVEEKFNDLEVEQEPKIIENNDAVDEILEEPEEEEENKNDNNLSSKEKFFDDIATDSELDELIGDEEDIENNNIEDASNNNVGDALNNNVGDALHASRIQEDSFEDIASKSDIEIKKENLPVLKATTYWCYWYVDEANNTIHYSSTEPAGYSSYTYKGCTSGSSSSPQPESSIRDSIVSAIFDDTIIAQTCKNWFSGFTNLATISYIDRLDTSNATSMSQMFYGLECLKIVQI